MLAAVDAGVLPLARAIEALTTGPAAVLGRHGAGASSPFGDGEPADLVVIDRGATWRVERRVAPFEGQELAAARARAARAWCG